MAKVRMSLTVKEAEALATVVGLGEATLSMDGREVLAMDGREEAAFYRAFDKLYEAMRKQREAAAGHESAR